jgi:crotonobetainyl-CoA:carnitine CoA-transferase CaiB-like acyl-CoA transferase
MKEILTGLRVKGLDIPVLAADPRFLTKPIRDGHGTQLHSALVEETKLRAVVQIVAALRSNRAPCSELHSIDQMLSRDQIKASGVDKQLPVAGGLTYQVVALPVRTDDTRGLPFKQPSTPGADTDTLLTALGYDSSRLRDLRECLYSLIKTN